jgi:hypothetical protein
MEFRRSSNSLSYNRVQARGERARESEREREREREKSGLIV